MTEEEFGDNEPCRKFDVVCKMKSFFNNIFSGTLGILTSIKYFVVFVLGAFSIFVSNDFLKRNGTLRRNNPARVIFSILIGVGIGVILSIFIGSLIFWGISVAVLLYLFFAPRIKIPLRLSRGK